MKKSTYIIIGFLVFFLGTILAMHIDSKLYEPKHKKTEEIRENYSIVYGYLNKKDLTLERWNEFIERATVLNTKTNLFPGEIIRQANIVYSNYKRFNDTKSLEKAAYWCELALGKEPGNAVLNDTYAAIQFNLGFVDKAIKHEQLALNFTNSDNRANVYKTRLYRYENFHTITTIKIGDKYEDANLFKIDNTPVKLSSLIDSKPIILSFYAAGTDFSVEKHRKLLPLYNQFKDKGLQVIGITKAHTTSERLKNNVNREKLPWVNLFDVYQRERTWDKYSFVTSDNGFVLIDKNGIVVSIETSTDKLKFQLKTLLN
jgi:peroxiredoxin